VARLKRLYLKGKLLDLPHPFEEELGWLVSTNHRLVMENVSRIEEEAVATADHLDLPEIHAYSDELRRAANSLALVGLVTRLHHWVSLFVEELTNKHARDKGLGTNLKTLNKRTGEGPIPIGFFQELATVRNSIIHADSKIAWTYNGDEKRVAERYVNVSLGEIEFTQTHLQEAIEKATKQIKWYDERLDSLNPLS
jgi:hypothetical protein